LKSPLTNHLVIKDDIRLSSKSLFSYLIEKLQVSRKFFGLQDCQRLYKKEKQTTFQIRKTQQMPILHGDNVNEAGGAA